MESSDGFERGSSVMLTRPRVTAHLDANDDRSGQFVGRRATSFRRPRRSRVVAAVLIALAVVAAVVVATEQFDSGGSDIIAGSDESRADEPTTTTEPELDRASVDETDEVSPTTTITTLVTITPVGHEEAKPDVPDTALPGSPKGRCRHRRHRSRPQCSTTSAPNRPGIPTLAEQRSTATTTETTAQVSVPVTTSPGSRLDESTATSAAQPTTQSSTGESTTTQRTTTTSQQTTTTQQAATTSEETTTTRQTTTTSAPVSPPQGRVSTDAVVSQLPAGAVRFFSNNDGCAGLGQGQPHPDWLEGQSTSGNNSDGTPTYGFAYNTGDSTRGQISWGFVPRPDALSGGCVLSMGVNGAHDSTRAVRIFRRYDQNGNHLPADAYYSAWFYFPTEVSFDNQGVVDGQNKYGFWNVFQLKNKIRQPNGSLASLANLSVNAGKVTGGSHMAFRIWWKSQCGDVEECGAAAFIDPLVDLPIPTGRWVHVELRVRARTDESGRVQLWQDGTKIVDFTGVTERPNTERREWSVNNYGQLHRPSNHVLYVDDALISTQAVHPLLFD